MGYIVDMRTRKPFSREERTKSARLIVIAAEGRKTENIYFQRLKLEHEAQNVHVEILEREDNNSNPETVFQQISKYAKDYDIREDDQLWVVVDRDRWKSKQLASVAKKCSQKSNFHFCQSQTSTFVLVILVLKSGFFSILKGLRSILIKIRSVSARIENVKEVKLFLRNACQSYSEDIMRQSMMLVS